MYAISGNHDHATKNLIGNEAVSALSHLAQAFPDNFFLIDNGVAEVEIGVYVCGIPYYEYKKHFDDMLDECVEGLKDLPEDSEKYLMIHQTSKGMIPALAEYEADPEDPRYDNFNHVFAGHIHIHKELSPGFVSVGSPIHKDASDVGYTKGFLVMDLSKPSDGFKRVPLVGYPEFVRQGSDGAENASDGDYVIESPARLARPESLDTDTLENFNVDLPDVEILTNYWNEVDGEDKDLLETGLKFIK
jgi:DNA repair exonuclease SbcCD nuclease subunit